MQPRPGVTQNLARFVVDTRWEDIPEQARHEAKRALLNFFAVALAGCRTEPVEIALKSLAEFSGGKQATVVGRSERIDALSAAFLNAAGANVFDYCDTHLPTVVHPTAPLAPALLALAELRRVTGPRAAARLRAGLRDRMPDRRARSRPAITPRAGTSPRPAACSAAAAGAGKLLGLDVRARWCGRSATPSTQSAGLCECLGWPAKSVSVGNAARNGLWSALLAEKGFAGPPEPIAGAQGFLAAMGEPPNWAALTDGLGETWEVAQQFAQALSGGLRDPSAARSARSTGGAQHPDAASRRSRCAAIRCCCSAPTGPRSRPAAKSQVSLQHARRRRAGAGQGGARSVHRRLRQRSRRVGRCAARSRWRRDPAISTIAAEMDFVDRRTARSTASRPRPRAAARPIR